jgi:FlaG/FlaF family flagellin (archaellin)
MKKFTLLLLIPLLFSCKEENEDVVNQPTKDGSIEASVSTKHAGSVDILTTEYKVWVKGKVEKEFTKIDTLKSLGTTKEEGEDSEGNTQEVTVPKDYEIFISVK